MTLIRRKPALFFTAFAMALCAAPSAGCLAGPDDVDVDPGAERVAEDESELYVSSGDIWGSTIPVCWENPSQANAVEREWVHMAAVNSWQAQSNVKFTGWGACSGPLASGLRIRIADEGPHTEGLGDDLDGVPSGMVLNFTFNNWSTGCQSMRQFCIEAIAVHEFGHALGFAHEQNRSDTPSWCDQEQGSDGDTLVGAWDVDSVMNYCNPDWNGNGELSTTDIQGVRQYYGAPSCPHRACEQGQKLASTCDPCAAKICAADPYCCNNTWDAICVSEVQSLCAQSCNPYDVGVIPNADACPAGVEKITIRMDDEDDGNANSRSGWLGATLSSNNTTFKFCRVDGSQFRPLTTTAATSKNYAVLKLGSTCPNGSQEIYRRWDNEDSGNANWFTASISNPQTMWPSETSTSSKGFTRLHFCLFRSGSTTMSSFPQLGFSYGVFAPSVFSYALATGSLYTDDEDSNNGNTYFAPEAAITSAQQIVSSGSNTTVRMARVTW